jgi:hypothetical protein
VKRPQAAGLKALHAGAIMSPVAQATRKAKPLLSDSLDSLRHNRVDIDNEAEGGGEECGNLSQISLTVTTTRCTIAHTGHSSVAKGVDMRLPTHRPHQPYQAQHQLSRSPGSTTRAAK